MHRWASGHTESIPFSDLPGPHIAAVNQAALSLIQHARSLLLLCREVGLLIATDGKVQMHIFMHGHYVEHQCLSAGQLNQQHNFVNWLKGPAFSLSFSKGLSKDLLLLDCNHMCDSVCTLSRLVNSCKLDTVRCQVSKFDLEVQKLERTPAMLLRVTAWTQQTFIAVVRGCTTR